MEKTAIALIDIFQHAILNFTQKVEAATGLSDRDIENANVIVGMATVNIAVLQQVIARGENFYRRNCDKVDRQLRDASGFAAALQAEGFGVSVGSSFSKR